MAQSKYIEHGSTTVKAHLKSTARQNGKPSAQLLQSAGLELAGRTADLKERQAQANELLCTVPFNSVGHVPKESCWQRCQAHRGVMTYATNHSF